MLKHGPAALLVLLLYFGRTSRTSNKFLHADLEHCKLLPDLLQKPLYVPLKRISVGFGLQKPLTQNLNPNSLLLPLPPPPNPGTLVLKSAAKGCGSVAALGRISGGSSSASPGSKSVWRMSCVDVTVARWRARPEAPTWRAEARRHALFWSHGVWGKRHLLRPNSHYRTSVLFSN